MLKLAGAVLVFVAASLYGRGLCEKTKKKLALLEALEDFISYIGESIETLRLPLGRIFEDYHNAFLEEIGFMELLRRDGLAVAICSIEKDLPPDIFDSVSYTHLDVYKRQDQGNHCRLLLFPSHKAAKAVQRQEKGF